MKLTRYELEFDGQPQEVGFIQGLKSQGIDGRKIDKLIESFNNNLAIPNYSKFEKEEGKYIAAFFTKEGIDRFKKEIRKIISYTKSQNNGFGIFKKTIEIGDNDLIVYKDNYQVLLKINYKN